jgi:hypothetical protein
VTVIDQELLEVLIALTAAESRYHMAVEAIDVCQYSPDQDAVARVALEPLREEP